MEGTEPSGAAVTYSLVLSFFCRSEGNTSSLWHEVVKVAIANLTCGDSRTPLLMGSSLCSWSQLWGTERSPLLHHSSLLPSMCVCC